MSEEPEYDEDGLEESCWNCNGETFVASCFEEWARVDSEGGCDLCLRRCDVCHPKPRNADLDAVLSDALAASQEQPA